MENFKITIDSPDKERGIYYDTVEGERVQIGTEACFVFEECEETEHGTVCGYNVSHMETGMRIYSHLSKFVAIEMAKSRVAKYPEYIEKGRDICRSLNIQLPVNV